MLRKTEYEDERNCIMRENAIWVALHKIWEDSSSSGRSLRYLQQQTTGQALWVMNTAEQLQRFPKVPAELWEKLSARNSNLISVK